MDSWYGVNRSGDFDQQAMAGLGQDIYGDFDQLSLHGVDFGEDYCQDYGIEPTNLEGDNFMGSYQQMGADYDQMGIVPSGMGKYEHQMGIMPSGLGGYHNQMGIVPSGMGTHNYQMGIMPAGLAGMMDDMKVKYAMMTPTMKSATVAAALLLGTAGFFFALRKAGVIKKKLPLIG